MAALTACPATTRASTCEPFEKVKPPVEAVYVTRLTACSVVAAIKPLSTFTFWTVALDLVVPEDESADVLTELETVPVLRMFGTFVEAPLFVFTSPAFAVHAPSEALNVGPEVTTVPTFTYEP